jgi:hypothetical protein
MNSKMLTLTNQILQAREYIDFPFIGFKPFHVRRIIVAKFYSTKRNRPVIR